MWGPHQYFRPLLLNCAFFLIGTIRGKDTHPHTPGRRSVRLGSFLNESDNKHLNHEVHVYAKKGKPGLTTRGTSGGGGKKKPIPCELSGHVGQRPCCLQAIVCIRGQLLPSKNVLGWHVFPLGSCFTLQVRQGYSHGFSGFLHAYGVLWD